MNAQVDEASAARQRRIPEPPRAGAVSVVEREVGGKRLAKLPQALADRLHGGRVPVRQIDSEQPVGFARDFEHRLDLRCAASEGLLAEDRGARLERMDALVRVQRARRRNYNSVRLAGEQFIE